MDLARNCGECEFYTPSSAAKGLCDRLEDPSCVYVVRAEEVQCIYGNAGKRELLETVGERGREAAERRLKFLEHCENASKVIEGWPEWKKNLLG